MLNFLIKLYLKRFRNIYSLLRRIIEGVYLYIFRITLNIEVKISYILLLNVWQYIKLYRIYKS